MNKRIAVLLSLLLFSTEVCLSSSSEKVENLKTGVVKITSTNGGMTRIGTGVIVKVKENSAFIITASHVVEGDPNPLLNFYTDPYHSFKSRVIGLEGGDPRGLAVLMLEDKIPINLKVFSIDQTISLSGGEKGMLIGFPRIAGTPWMVTPVTIGGRKGGDLTFSGVADEGNSGGPIIIDGKVVGIITRVTNQFGYATPATSVLYALEGWNILPKIKTNQPLDGNSQSIVQTSPNVQSPQVPKGTEEFNIQSMSINKLISILEIELLYKNHQIETLLQQFNSPQKLIPSTLAKEVAKTLPKEGDPYSLALKAMGEARYDEARDNLDQVIHNHQQELGKAYLAYGHIEESNLRFYRAEEWYKKALFESPQDPDIMERLGHVLVQRYNLLEAEKVFLKALSIAEKLFERKHYKVIGLKTYLVLVYSGLGKKAIALNLAKEALLDWKASKGPEHHMVGLTLGLIGTIYTNYGEFEKADEAFQKGISVLEKSPWTDRSSLAGAWCLAAMSPLMAHQYEKAVSILKHGRNVSSELDFYPDWLCNFYLGGAYVGQRQWHLAETHLEKALQLAKENLEPHSQIVAISSIVVAAFYHDQKRINEAHPLARLGVEILEKELKPNYFGPSFLLDILIGGYQMLGENEKANTLIEIRASRG